MILTNERKNRNLRIGLFIMASLALSLALFSGCVVGILVERRSWMRSLSILEDLGIKIRNASLNGEVIAEKDEEFFYESGVSFMGKRSVGVYAGVIKSDEIVLEFDETGPRGIRVVREQQESD